MMGQSSKAYAQTAPQGVWFTIYEADVTVPAGTSLQHITVYSAPDNLRFTCSPNGTFSNSEDDTWYINTNGGSYSAFSSICNYGGGGSAVASGTTGNDIDFETHRQWSCCITYDTHIKIEGFFNLTATVTGGVPVPTAVPTNTVSATNTINLPATATAQVLLTQIACNSDPSCTPVFGGGGGSFGTFPPYPTQIPPLTQEPYPTQIPPFTQIPYPTLAPTDTPTPLPPAQQTAIAIVSIGAVTPTPVQTPIGIGFTDVPSTPFVCDGGISVCITEIPTPADTGYKDVIPFSNGDDFTVKFQSRGFDFGCPLNINNVLNITAKLCITYYEVNTIRILGIDFPLEEICTVMLVALIIYIIRKR